MLSKCGRLRIAPNGMKLFGTGRIQKAILEFICEIAEDAADLSVAMLLSGMSSRELYRQLNEQKKHRFKSQVTRSLKQLEKAGVIQVKIKSGEPYIRPIINKDVLSKIEVDNVVLRRSPKWDGVWHMVIFDIPEKFGKARRALSYRTEKTGALRLQDSVFVYPFPWRKEIETISEIYKVHPYVRYIEATSIDGSDQLKKHFGL